MRFPRPETAENDRLKDVTNWKRASGTRTQRESQIP